jgi:hypothetical protein
MHGEGDNPKLPMCRGVLSAWSMHSSCLDVGEATSKANVTCAVFGQAQLVQRQQGVVACIKQVHVSGGSPGEW